MADFVHYLPGGGLGDVFREAYFHNAVGVLKRWKTLNPQHRLTLLLMSHNPSAADFFVGQDWIDEVKLLRFPLERTWEWQACYAEYPEEFAGKTELRLTLPVRASLYRADMHACRPRAGALGNVETLPNVGMAWDLALCREERQRVEEVAFDADRDGTPFVTHPFAGQEKRCWHAHANGEALVDAVAERLRQARGATSVTVGADYARPEHGPEAGETLPPRLLAHLLRHHARGVIASESSVYYLASMLGVPLVMLYAPGETFDRVQRRQSDWDWFFGQNDPRNLFLPLPVDAANYDRLTRWIQERSDSWR